jgi:methanol metabolism-related c-type cytochrome
VAANTKSHTPHHYNVFMRLDMQHSKANRPSKSAAIALICSIAFFSAASIAKDAAKDADMDYKTFVPSPEHPYLFKDGKVDFGTYNGFRRYHSACHVCHGPAGLGSSYAPALKDSMKVLSWGDFINTVISGRVGLDERVMPSFAKNANVIPYLSDIYAYLKARADGVIGRNRPDHFPKVKKPTAAASK